MEMSRHGTGNCDDSCCLKISGLTVNYGGDKVLDGVNLHLHCGEIVALLGPNGAGKSTLLKAVLGLVPYSGTIEFHTAGGEKMTPLIGYVPQNPSFDKGDPISVLDLFVSFISNHPVFLPIPKMLRLRILNALRRVHSEALIDKQIGSLSGGELQRVLLALALEPLPHILILDEPTSGIDVEGVGMLTDILNEIRAEYDLSILLSTHDFSIAGYATKAVLLNKRVLISGSPGKVIDSPEFRAAFNAPGGGKDRMV